MILQLHPTATAVCSVYQIGNDNFMIYITFSEKNKDDISACVPKVKFLGANFENNRKPSC